MSSTVLKKNVSAPFPCQSAGYFFTKAHFGSAAHRAPVAAPLAWPRSLVDLRLPLVRCVGSCQVVGWANWQVELGKQETPHIFATSVGL